MPEMEIRITAKATKLSDPICITTDDAMRAAELIRLLKASGQWREIRVNGKSK